jgi:hypothetical protein
MAKLMFLMTGKYRDMGWFQKLLKEGGYMDMLMHKTVLEKKKKLLLSHVTRMGGTYNCLMMTSEIA